MTQIETERPVSDVPPYSALTLDDGAPSRRPRRIHPAWIVAAVALLTLVGAAGFRSAPGLLIDPLRREFGWSRSTISAAVSLNLLLYGLASPFAAALMERFGVRRVVPVALGLIAAGSGLTLLMTASWQLVMCWGLMVGLGAGSISMAFVATIVPRWFKARQGLVTGVLTAAAAAGNLVFLPLLGLLVSEYGWRAVAVAVSGGAVLGIPLVLVFLRERPSDLGVRRYGEEADVAVDAAVGEATGTARRVIGPLHALRVLREAARTQAFWMLAGGFAICGASTSGLAGTHFVPAAHDHGMTVPAAASLLALIGIFDLVGTVFSGWLTDRFDPRLLLGVYYTLRGASLFLLPLLFAASVEPGMLVFVIFYGLDWVATVPPTVALCRKHFGEDGAVVFAWTLAAHQVGAALIATGAAVMRDQFGEYDMAWYLAGVLCAGAAVMSVMVRGTSR